MKSKLILDYPKINEKVYEYELDNGLIVEIIKKKGYKKYIAAFATSFGGNDYEFLDKDTNTTIKLPYGTAHFLEHKTFELDDGGDVSILFSHLGINANAYTDYCHTCYYIDGYKNYDKALNLLIDFVQSPRFTKESINKEKGIILQEYKATLDSPHSKIIRQLKRNLYKCAYVKDILGNITSIANMSFNDIKLAYDTFYHPSNMILCIVGDVDVDKTIKLIEDNQNKKTFNKIPNIERVSYLEDKQVKKRSNLILEIPAPIVHIAFRIDRKNYDEKESIQLNLGLSMLIQKLCGTSSIAKEDMIKKRLIMSLDYDFQDNDPRYTFVYFIARTNKPDEYIKYMKKKKKNIKDSKLTEEEFDMYKKALIGQSMYKLNDIGELAFSYIDAKMSDKNYFDDIEKIKNLQIEDVNESSKYLDINNMTIVKAMPKTK